MPSSPFIALFPFIILAEICQPPCLFHSPLLFETQEYVVFKEHLNLNICSIRIVNGLLYELVSFACACLNDIMFVCVIGQIFSNMLVSKFFASQKYKAFLLFFSPRLLLSNWYYCVICGKKSLFIRKKSTSGKLALPCGTWYILPVENHITEEADHLIIL